jgi:uncharacterized ferredoxin-like protein
MRDQDSLECEAVGQVASLMAAAARTAPKTRGVDNIRIFALDDAESRGRVADKMVELARRDGRPSLERDARAVATSPAVLVIGVVSNPAGLDGCGFCGQKTCEAQQAAGGVCAFNSIDLGIAACSAASVASQNRVDSRVMFSIGKACVELKLFPAEVRQALGIPLSVTGKSPFFDRTA